ncbi:MAG: glycosyltransferase, partial [Candidatus Poribacteria bacterium]
MGTKPRVTGLAPVPNGRSVLLLHSYPPTPCLYGFEKGLKALGYDVRCVGPYLKQKYEAQFREIEPECEYIEPPALDAELSEIFEMSGGQPDWVLLLQPDRAFLPRGLRDCPVPTIAWWTEETKFADTDQSLYYYFDAAPTVLEAHSDACRERNFDNCPCFNFILMNWLNPTVEYVDRPIDVAFVGSLNRTISRLRGRELEKLLRLSDEGIHVVVREGMYLHDMLDVYARSKIVWQHSGQGGNNLTFRVSEAMSTGAFVLAPRPDDLAGLGDEGLDDGTHLVFYDDFDEARDLILYYIEHEDERKRIADAGRRHLSEKSWVSEVERFVDEIVDAIPPDFLERRHERLRHHGVDARRERMDYARYFFMNGEFAVARRLYEDTPNWSEDAALLHHQSLAALHEGQQVNYVGVVHAVLSEHPDHLIALFNCVCGVWA